MSHLPRYAGVAARYPNSGDVVEVDEGEHQGQQVEVIDVRGHAFSEARKVVIETIGGERAWYWPWNLRF